MWGWEQHNLLHYSLIYGNFTDMLPLQERGDIPAASSLDDRSRYVDESISGASVANVATPSLSCGCGDQTSVLGAAVGMEQIEEMIDKKLAPLMAKNVESVDGKLAALHADLHSWTQQFVMAELTNKQQTSEAQRLADRSANNDKYAELVCSPVSLLSFCYAVIL